MRSLNEFIVDSLVHFEHESMKVFVARAVSLRNFLRLLALSHNVKPKSERVLKFFFKANPQIGQRIVHSLHISVQICQCFVRLL